MQGGSIMNGRAGKWSPVLDLDLHLSEGLGLAIAIHISIMTFLLLRRDLSP